MNGKYGPNSAAVERLIDAYAAADRALEAERFAPWPKPYQPDVEADYPEVDL